MVAEITRAEILLPADVFIPRWRTGPAVRLDSTVTSGLRPDIIVESANTVDVLGKRSDAS